MKFSQIVGQEQIKKRLRQTAADNRVSHAQLFLGPEGSGKLGLAIAYAQYINCRNRTPEDSCGECPSCKKYAKLIHPDLHFIFPVNKTKDVDEKKVFSRDFLIPWRELLLQKNSYISLPEWYEKIGIEKKQGLINADEADGVNRTLAYKSYEAEYKVMIIWMVEKMNQTAANKLLKNLEEPPDKTLFILIAENQDQIISTILSRTQLVKIPPLEDDDISRDLQNRFSIPQSEAMHIARLADGNFASAFMMASPEIGKTMLKLQTDRFVLFREWMRRCFSISNKLKDYTLLQETIAQIAADGNREKLKEMLTYGLHIFRLCLQQHIGNVQLIKLDGEELDFVQKFSPFVHVQNIQYLEDEFNRAIFHIERNASVVIVLTDLSHLTARILRISETTQAKKV